MKDAFFVIGRRRRKRRVLFFPFCRIADAGFHHLLRAPPSLSGFIFYFKASLWIFSAQITCYCETTCRKYVAYGRSTKPGSAWASLPKWLSRQEEEGEKKSLLIKLNEEEGEEGLSMKGGRRKGSFFSFSHSSSGAWIAGVT